MVDQVTNLKLVEEIEKRPCLYNYTLTSYSRKDITEKAWSEIGQKINLPGRECKERWKNIRAVFIRHMKPTEDNSRKYKKRYYLAEAMQFAIPYIKGLKSNNKNNSQKPPIQTESNEQSDGENDENPLIINESGYYGSLSRSPVEYITYTTGSPLPSPSPNSAPPLSPQSYSLTSPSHGSKQMKRTNTNRDQADLEQINTDYLPAKKNRCDVDSESLEEANRMFLLSLLPDMNLMSLSQTRQFKRKIIDFIDEVLEDTSKDKKRSGASSSTSHTNHNPLTFAISNPGSQMIIKEEIIH